MIQCQDIPYDILLRTIVIIINNIIIIAVPAPLLATLAVRESNGTHTAGSALAACRVSCAH